MSGPLAGDLHGGWGWARLFSRLLLGLLFLMPGWHKVFVMGPGEHARRLFLEGFRDHWIPEWILWPLGVTIPFLELAAGILLVIGLWTRGALVAVGMILVTVTYGHLLQEPFFDITTHVFPRALLLLAVLALPREVDRWTVDALLRHRAGAGDGG